MSFFPPSPFHFWIRESILLHLTPILKVLNTQLTAPPIQNIIFSLCVAATETGNGERLSETLLCDSVSNRRGWGAFGRSGWAGGGGGHCCSRHVASVGCLRSAMLIIPRNSGQ